MRCEDRAGHSVPPSKRMRHRHWNRIAAVLFAAAIIAALAYIASPELRVLLLVSDSLGLDLLVLLLLTQLKDLFYVSYPMSIAILSALCLLVHITGSAALRIYPRDGTQCRVAKA